MPLNNLPLLLTRSFPEEMLTDSPLRVGHCLSLQLNSHHFCLFLHFFAVVFAELRNVFDLSSPALCHQQLALQPLFLFLLFLKDLGDRLENAFGLFMFAIFQKKLNVEQFHFALYELSGVELRVVSEHSFEPIVVLVEVRINCI